jgi:tetratricopeptide (TPR) repeat protein
MDQIALRDQVDRIVGGWTFAQKAQLRSLLRILGDHYESQNALQPARVIRELWPDDESRESKDLAAAMYRLRHALAEYYGGEGASDTILISLPRRAGEAAGDRGRQWIIADLREAPNAAVAVCDEPCAELREVRFVDSQATPTRSPAISAGQKDSFRPLPSIRWLITAISGVMVLLIPLPYLLHEGRLDPQRKTARSLATADGVRHVPVPNAEQLYLRGRYYWNLRTADGLAKAVDFYTQAIVSDPSYADAYAGLAESYDLLPQFGHADFEGSMKKAEYAADRAIALNPNLADAYAAKAFALFYGDWDIAGSDAEFLRALVLDTNSARTHHWYASTLHDRMEKTACLQQISDALRLDPTSAAIATDDAFFQADFGDVDTGVKVLQEIERTQPSLATPPDFLRAIDFATGDFLDYIAQTRRYAEITHDPDDIALADAVARGWAHAGKAGLVEERANALRAAFDHRHESGFKLGETLVLLGRKKEALNYFRAALSRDDLGILFMLQLPWAQKLATDPGYAAFFAQVRKRVHRGNLPPGTDVLVEFGLPW